MATKLSRENKINVIPKDLASWPRFMIPKIINAAIKANRE
jgi:hypothetical protein